jgi:CheY-like chemotaxis protein
MIKLLLALGDAETTSFMEMLITNNFNCDLQITNDGVKAIEYTFKWKPDFLILDIGVAKLSGLKVLERIRNAKGFEKLPVVIVTASRDKETIRKIIELDVIEFFLWPIDPVLILEKLRNIITAIEEAKFAEEASSNLAYFKSVNKPLSFLQYVNKIKSEEVLFQEELKKVFPQKQNIIILDKNKKFERFFSNVFAPWFNVIEVLDVVSLVDVLKRRKPDFILVDDKIRGIGNALLIQTGRSLEADRIKIFKMNNPIVKNELDTIMEEVEQINKETKKEQEEDDFQYNGEITKCYSPSSLVSELSSYLQIEGFDYKQVYDYIKRQIVFYVINSLNQACETVLREVVLYYDEKIANTIPAQAEAIIEFTTSNNDVQIISSIVCDQKDLLVVASKIMGGPIQNVQEVPIVFSRLLEKAASSYISIFQKMALDVSSSRAKFFINKDSTQNLNWNIKIPIELMGGYRILFRMRWVGFL